MCIFPTRRISAFPSFFLATSFFPRLRKKRKRRRREHNKPPFVRFLRHSDYLLHAIPHSVDSEEDLFFSFCFPSTSALLHYVPFHLSHDRALTSLFYSSARTRRAFTRSYNCRKEPSTRARNLYRTASFSFAQGCISERILWFLVEECYAFTRAMKEISAKWKSLGVLCILKGFHREVKKNICDKHIKQRL